MQFDAQNFMNQVFDETNDDKRAICPAGEFLAQIIKVEPKSGTIGKGERVGEPWASLSIQWNVTDPAVLALAKRDKVVVFQSVMLDLTANGGLDMGEQRNIALGQLRTSLGQNTKGQPWSPVMMTGQMAKIRVKHVPGFKNPEELQAEVSGVIRA